MPKAQDDKLRVYEYAKNLDMSSKEIITILKRVNMPVNNHMSVMEPEMVTAVENFFSELKAKAAAKRSGAPVPQQPARPAQPAQAAQAPSQAQQAKPAAKPQQTQQTQQRPAAQAPSQPRGQQQERSGFTKSTSSFPISAGQTAPIVKPSNEQGERKSFDSYDTRSDRSPNKPAQARPPQRRNDGYNQGGFRGGQGNRNNKFNKNKNFQQPKKEKIDNTPKKIIVRGEMTVGEFAKLLHKEVAELIKKLFMSGIMATINHDLDLDTIQLIAQEYGVEVELKLPVEEDPFEMEDVAEEEENLKERPPVVTIMGHVDHGKTTLLDAIRETRVTEGEAGGITQHIGAYQVEIKGKKITFLDTPGHEAFTMMRARGAKVTDITILVVAADDGVMPQTVEAINHAKAANVPIIVAVNKIDKPEANIDRIKQELSQHGLISEEWGGDTIFVEVSAKQRINLDSLLEMILLVAEVQELRANPDALARGTVIEAELDKGRGPVARILVQSGTLKIGDPLVAGNMFGRVRSMVNDKGRRLKEVGPSTPVELTGLNGVPHAGDQFIVFENESKAREIADKRAASFREDNLGRNTKVTLDDLFAHIQDGDIKELNVIIKGDVQGSVEALRGSLEKIDIEGVRVRIIHTGAGAITESDIILASASNAIIIGFNVRPEPAAKVTADEENVDIRLHSIIYNVIAEIESAMKGMLDPIYKENIIGQADVRNIIKISKVGNIAGSMIINGKIQRNAGVRLIREGIVVFEGKIDALKRFKEDVKEVAQGYECGISLDGYHDIKEGDIIEAYLMETVER